MERATLRLAHLERAGLTRAHLGGADLRLVVFDIGTAFDNVVLRDGTLGPPLMGGIRWNGVDLSAVDWTQLQMLGEEVIARDTRKPDGHRKPRQEQLQEYEAAVRATRQLVTALRTQTLADDGDRFAYRAQILRRHVLRLQRNYLCAFGSWLLDLISGYGYRPLRSLITYLKVILGFAVTYYLLGPHASVPLQLLSAIVFSITSFHGRGFSPGENVALSNPVTILAALEAIVGLLIEITFIATFTQRFFAR